MKRLDFLTLAMTLLAPAAGLLFLATKLDSASKPYLWLAGMAGLTLAVAFAWSVLARGAWPRARARPVQAGGPR